jgi:hypothetical protein
MPGKARQRVRVLAVLLWAAAGFCEPAAGEDAWNPFQRREQIDRERRQPARADPERPPPLAPMDGAGGPSWREGPRPAWGQRPAEPVAGPALSESGAGPVIREALPPPGPAVVAVERAELQPVMTADGSGLPAEMWHGVDLRAVEELLSRLEMPPRSRALRGLWRRLWTAQASPPAGAAGPAHFEAMRLEVLFRSGLLKEAEARARATPENEGPLLAAVRARLAIALGDRETGCEQARRLAGVAADPSPMKGEMLLLSAYCAAADGNVDGARLALEIAGAEGASAAFAASALDAISAGQAFRPGVVRRLTLIDYRFLELARGEAGADLLAAAEPPLLVALSHDGKAAPHLRIAAAEAATRSNVLDPAMLAEVYRATAPAGGDVGDPMGTGGDPAARRANLFRAFEAERTPMRKARLMRALLDDARRAGLGSAVAVALARGLESLVPAAEVGWIAETAIEVGLAAGRPDVARRWLDFAQGDRGEGLQHWRLLADLADAGWRGPRGESFPAVEHLALRGRFASESLHRLVTVLDALDYQIPIPLWQEASRTPQPKEGHLPETGVLSHLQEASRRRELARTVLLAAQALGPATADRAHIIALGDAVRALRRAGLEADARALAVEAVIGGWPRMVTE